MFNRSQGKQGKQQGFAKEQRIADAQLASLKQLGLIGRDKKGFASAWGGTEPITTASGSGSGSGSGSAARSRSNYTTIKPPGDPDDGPSFPEKGELSFSFPVFLIPFPSHTACHTACHNCTLLFESPGPSSTARPPPFNWQVRRARAVLLLASSPSTRPGEVVLPVSEG